MLFWILGKSHGLYLFSNPTFQMRRNFKIRPILHLNFHIANHQFSEKYSIFQLANPYWKVQSKITLQKEKWKRSQFRPSLTRHKIVRVWEYLSFILTNWQFVNCGLPTRRSTEFLVKKDRILRFLRSRFYFKSTAGLNRYRSGFWFLLTRQKPKEWQLFLTFVKRCQYRALQDAACIKIILFGVLNVKNLNLYIVKSQLTSKVLDCKIDLSKSYIELM